MDKATVFGAFRVEMIPFEGTEGYVVFPDGKPNGKMAFKTEYWERFPELEIELLKRGFHVVHVQNIIHVASREDCDRKARFIELVSKKYNLDKKCVLIGMSIGGAQAMNFAGFYPQYAACLVLDAPAVNFVDVYGRYDMLLHRWEEMKSAYPKVKIRADLLKLEENPANQINALVNEHMPIVMLYGTEDQTVEYARNGKLIEEAYEGKDELLTIIPRKSEGHHPHGLLDKSDMLADIVLSKLGM